MRISRRPSADAKSSPAPGRGIFSIAPHLSPFVCAIAGVLLAGCASLGPDYKAPGAQAPVAFKNAPGLATTPSISSQVESWWTVFGDPTLDRLETSALANSPSLAAVLARVDEARARLGVIRSDTRPSLSTSGNAKLAGESAERMLPLPGHPITYREKGDSYRLGFDAGYELDLWGRVRRSVESADAQFSASVSDERGARLALTADVAQSYLQLRGLETEAAVLARTLESRREGIAVLQARARAGYSNELDLERARSDLASVEAESAEQSRRLEQLVNALAVLTGEAPSAFSHEREVGKLPAIPSIPSGLPADILKRRPDLASSEATLHARMAEIGVAEAARYPSIRLTGSAGFESPDLGSLLQRPAQFWQLGPTLSLPILDGGRSKANIQVAKARAEAARADHRQRTLQALREVEDALVDLRQQAEQAAAFERGQTAASLALQLAQTRYDRGMANYLEVLDAQRSTLQFERNQAQIGSSRLASTVRLIRALGGTWN